jgi:hypothetical protein
MRNTARSHFVEVVLPALSTFTEHYAAREIGLRRDTKNAAVVAESLRDLPEHVSHDLKGTFGSALTDLKQYRESFWPNSREYEILCDFANAWKHRYLSRQGKSISSLDDVQECLLHVRYEDSEGFYYGVHKTVILRVIDGREYELSALISESIKLWMVELTNKEILTKAIPIPAVEWHPYSRADLARLTNMRVIGQAGEYLEIGQRRAIYQYDLQALVPVPAGEVFESQSDVEFDILPSPFD